MELSEIRRINLRKMMESEGALKLAGRLGYRQSSFLSQMAGPNPTREITEKTARAYEKQLGLEPVRSVQTGLLAMHNPFLAFRPRRQPYLARRCEQRPAAQAVNEQGQLFHSSPSPGGNAPIR